MLEAISNTRPSTIFEVLTNSATKTYSWPYLGIYISWILYSSKNIIVPLYLSFSYDTGDTYSYVKSFLQGKLTFSRIASGACSLSIQSMVEWFSMWWATLASMLRWTGQRPTSFIVPVLPTFQSFLICLIMLIGLYKDHGAVLWTFINCTIFIVNSGGWGLCPDT